MSWRRRQRQIDNALHLNVANAARGAWTWLVEETIEPLVQKSTTPAADRQTR